MTISINDPTVPIQILSGCINYYNYYECTTYVCVYVCACFLSLSSCHAEGSGVASGSAEQCQRTLLTLRQKPEETAGRTWGEFVVGSMAGTVGMVMVLIMQL